MHVWLRRRERGPQRTRSVVPLAEDLVPPDVDHGGASEDGEEDGVRSRSGDFVRSVGGNHGRGRDELRYAAVSKTLSMDPLTYRHQGGHVVMMIHEAK